MIINYASWPSTKISTVNLKLDEQNPRLPASLTNDFSSQGKIIDYFVEHETTYELAKRIAVMGYLPNEEPIVYKEGKKYVVLEGNRRVTACKLLLQPDLLKSKAKAKNLAALVKETGAGFIEKLIVKICPSREAADVIIVNRHTEGSAIEKWDKTKQDRFFHHRLQAGETMDQLSAKFGISKSDLKDGLKRYHFYEEMLKAPLPIDLKTKVTNESTFNMTNVERFYGSKHGKEFLGIDFTVDGKITHKLPKIEYDKRLQIISEWVVNDRLNSRTYGREKEQKELVTELWKTPEINSKITSNKKYN